MGNCIWFDQDDTSFLIPNLEFMESVWAPLMEGGTIKKADGYLCTVDKKMCGLGVAMFALGFRFAGQENRDYTVDGPGAVISIDPFKDQNGGEYIGRVLGHLTPEAEAALCFQDEGSYMLPPNVTLAAVAERAGVNVDTYVASFGADKCITVNIPAINDGTRLTLPEIGRLVRASAQMWREWIALNGEGHGITVAPTMTNFMADVLHHSDGNVIIDVYDPAELVASLTT